MADLMKNDLRDRIHDVRGLQIIIDRDLAELYEVSTKALNQGVKRNLDRFPEDFRFQLTDTELDELVTNCDRLRPLKHSSQRPFAFTEQGVASLSGVLKSEKAIQVNIQVIRAFVAMRRFIASNAQVFYRLDRVERKQIDHDKKFEQVFYAIESRGIKPEKGIFFDGQVFDAYKFVSDLIRSADKSIILIDNYVDDTVLTMLCKRKAGVTVKIYTKDISKQLKLDAEKCNQQYPNVEIIKFTQSHDRFLILDDQEVYHIGASLKDLGKKWFSFSRMSTEIMSLLQYNIRDKIL